jgi:hypothetical protein
MNAFINVLLNRLKVPATAQRSMAAMGAIDGPSPISLSQHRAPAARAEANLRLDALAAARANGTAAAPSDLKHAWSASNLTRPPLAVIHGGAAPFLR